jgi:hypothetical protein
MRLRGWPLLALSSLLLTSLDGATRPRYGGTLTVELSAAWSTLDPGEPHGDPAPAIAETLVRLNSRGDIEPLLAVAWQRDADRKRWRFTLRPKVMFHDGEPLTAASAAPALTAALKKKYGEVTIVTGGQAMVVEAERPMPDLLEELAQSRSVIFRRSESNPLVGTGPFRVVSWEPGRKLALAAFEDYWDGRPYLDRVVIDFGAGRERADVFDIPFSGARRILPEGARIWSSAPRELVALVAVNVQPMLLEALALSLDRTPMLNVLAQRRGEAAFGLLPQWLTGYAFLFQAPVDTVRARQISAPLRAAALTLGYPANDSFARSVAERVALNARDGGIAIQPAPNPAANLRLVRWPLESNSATQELLRLAAAVGASDRAAGLDAAKPESWYEAERGLLTDHRIIPLLYLPEVFGVAARVHQPDGTLRLENIWVEP